MSTWEDVRSWFDEVGVKNEATDAVLRPVLVAAKQSPDEAWQNILLLLFWRSLARFHRTLMRLDPDHGAVGSQILWAFLQVLHRLDLDQRPAGIGQKILNDVQHDVRQYFAHERDLIGQCDPLLASEEHDEDANDAGCVSAPGVDDIQFVTAELRHDLGWARAYLKALVRQGRITGPDYLILIGCHLYGHSPEEMAKRLHMTRDAVRKRRQRVTNILKKEQKVCPTKPSRPPFKK